MQDEIISIVVIYSSIYGAFTMGQHLWEAPQTQWSWDVIPVVTLLPVDAGEGPLTASYKSEWVSRQYSGEGDGTPLQSSCLENPMDGGAW